MTDSVPDSVSDSVSDSASDSGRTDRRPIVLIKLGGSLITDKSQANSAKHEVIERLAGELAHALAADDAPRVVLGHGSGSFGHEAAHRAGIQKGLTSSDQLAGVAATRERAAALNALVVSALISAGVPAFAIAPSSCLISDDGRPAHFADEALVRALERGLMPVVFGDVVLDRSRGIAIASTEVVLSTVASRLTERGETIVQAIWLGDTPGIWNESGEILERIDPASAEAALAAAGGSAATDVTGGMAHRLRTTLDLARLGIPSLIADGRTPGLLARALIAATADAVPGSRVGQP